MQHQCAVRRVKKGLKTEDAVASYLFDATSANFLKNLAVSGTGATSTFTFLRALLIFPQVPASPMPLQHPTFLLYAAQ